MVTMHHPHAGSMECHESAVRVHERTGWVRVDGVTRVDVAAADGSLLTRGTVFPPETFDDDEPASSVDPAQPGAGDDTKTKADKATKTKEA